jgi:microcompartment protein CcmK/EutM
MPVDTYRSKSLSNQIGRMLVTTQYFVANGVQTDFVLAYECYYSDGFNPSDSQEAVVCDNGIKLEHVGAGVGEFSLIANGFGVYNTIHFHTTPPVSGHIISVTYRPVENKV